MKTSSAPSSKKRSFMIAFASVLVCFLAAEACLFPHFPEYTYASEPEAGQAETSQAEAGQAETSQTEVYQPDPSQPGNWTEDVGPNPFCIYDLEIPDYSGEQFIVMNGDEPYFTDEELAVRTPFEYYYDLDELGRATGAFAMVSLDTFPDYERGEMHFHPTGWVQGNYDFIDNGGWLYNRSHLIAFRMTGQHENPKNLITGARQFNLAMTPFEIQVLQYIENNNARVLYRVTPYFEGDNLVAKGVLMESYSIEDPEAATFCLFLYNVQDHVVIDYATGENHLEEGYVMEPVEEPESDQEESSEAA